MPIQKHSSGSSPRTRSSIASLALLYELLGQDTGLADPGRRHCHGLDPWLPGESGRLATGEACTWDEFSADAFAWVRRVSLPACTPASSSSSRAASRNVV